MPENTNPDIPCPDKEPSGPLDAALKAAFELNPMDSLRPGDSVLTVLRVKSGVDSEIRLKETGKGEPPAEGTAPGPRTGRYQVLGEIARGGLGVVMRGKDIDLGREVAMKLLHDRHAFNPVAIRRMVEEAQIGGQLQHPGIVPIYEMGLRADDRPYFTMKLVKGQTLAELLEARQDPAEKRMRFLRIIEQVCQTMAYAHTRGVIHRDLKPANIMVGAFGEVQLMDWGLAKVLGGKDQPMGEAGNERLESESPETIRTGSTEHLSRAGTVMGTYAYMAPEQARGETALLDERCDVFGLGSILCEILTGRPAFSGETPEETAEQARQGLLDPCWERLDASGVEPDLQDLCRRCLAPVAANRPWNAGVMTAEMESYLAQVAERARRSEVEAAENRVRADEAEARAVQERRARRLLLSLAATIIVALVIGGGTFAWIEHTQRERIQRMTDSVNNKLTEAHLKMTEAVGASDPGKAFEAWDLALKWTRDAQHDAHTEELDAGTRDRVESLFAELERGKATAREAFDRAEADRAMVSRLESIWFKLGKDWDWSAIDEGYASAYREYGIGVDELSIDEAAARIRKSAISNELVIGIHEWIIARQRTGQDQRRISEILRLADPDPWRDELRIAISRRDGGKIEALRKSKPVAELSPYDARLLGNALDHTGASKTAVALLGDAAWRHRDDFWIHFDLAAILKNSQPPRLDEAIGHYRAALAISPDSVGALSNLGLACTMAGRAEEARAAFEEALRLNPDDAITRWAYGGFLYHLAGDYDEAIRELEASIELKPDRSYTYASLGVAWQLKGNMEKAREAYETAVQLDPRNTDALVNLGIILMNNGDFEEALSCYEDAIAIDATRAMYHLNKGMILELLNRKDEAITALERTLERNGKLGDALARLGVLLGEKGEVKKAIDCLEQALRVPREPTSVVLSQAVDDDPLNSLRFTNTHAVALEGLGLIRWKQGRANEAVELFSRAVEEDSQFARPRFRLGMLFKEMGDLDRAEECHQKVRAIEPDHAGAMRELEKK